MTVLAAVLVAFGAGAAALAVSRLVTHRRVPDGPAPVAHRTRRRSERPSRSVWLRQAGATVTPVEFWCGSIGAAAATLLLIAAVTRAPVVAIGPAVAVGATPHLYFSNRRATRLRAAQAAWPDALRDLIAGIVAGRSLGQALTALGATGPEPLRVVFADFHVLSRMFGTAGALEQVKERLADPTSDRVLEVLVVAHERGGAIVRDVLEDLVVATTKDLQVLDEIETEGLEMRINARAVLVLPWLVLVALTLRPGPFRDFYRTTGGVLVLALAALLSAAGSAWLGRLGRQPDEPRVFAPRPPGRGR